MYCRSNSKVNHSSQNIFYKDDIWHFAHICYYLFTECLVINFFMRSLQEDTRADAFLQRKLYYALKHTVFRVQDTRRVCRALKNLNNPAPVLFRFATDGLFLCSRNVAAVTDSTNHTWNVPGVPTADFLPLCISYPSCD